MACQLVAPVSVTVKQNESSFVRAMVNRKISKFSMKLSLDDILKENNRRYTGRYQ